MLPPSLLHRLYSTSPSQSVKASVKLIAEIRKRVAGTSLTKAREALEATNNSLEDALSWLEKDIPTSGAAKAAKLQGRSTKEGLIALAILSHGGWKDRHPQGVRAAMVELNCETDFVSRNDLFVQLAHDISHTVAYITDPTPDATLKHSTELFKHLSLDMISDAPVVPTSPFASCSPSSTVATIGESIRNSVAKLGEKISLRRACTFVTEPLADKALGLVASSYVHGVAGNRPSSVNVQAGRLAALVGTALHSQSLSNILRGPAAEAFHGDLTCLTRSLAMQVAGLETTAISEGEPLRRLGDGDSSVLYNQPFMMQIGAPTDDSVYKVLEDWAKDKGMVGEGVAERSEGLRVVGFEKWTVGQIVPDLE